MISEKALMAEWHEAVALRNRCRTALQSAKAQEIKDIRASLANAERRIVAARAALSRWRKILDEVESFRQRRRLEIEVECSKLQQTLEADSPPIEDVPIITPRKKREPKPTPETHPHLYEKHKNQFMTDAEIDAMYEEEKGMKH